jgi:outer membrane biosynthesis protein TonB
MKLIIASCLLAFAGCAATTTTAHPGMPARISKPTLPSVEPLATEIVRAHRGLVTAQVRLCVAPSGAVDKVDLLSSSGMRAYDDAVVSDVSGWAYAPGAAPMCRKLSVSYRTP